MGLSVVPSRVGVHPQRIHPVHVDHSNSNARRNQSFEALRRFPDRVSHIRIGADSAVQHWGIFFTHTSIQ